MEKVLSEIKDRKSVYFFKNKEISKEKINLLIEAARWAPSSFNNQPWNYIFVHKKDKTRKNLEKALSLTNSWAKKAPYIVVVFAKKQDDTISNGIPYYLYDTGLSTMSLTIEAENQGLSTHHMAGWKAKKVRKALLIPEDYDIIVLIALGYSREKKGKKFFEKISGRLKEKVLRQRTRKNIKKKFFFEKFGGA
jgi:nitroreductase